MKVLQLLHIVPLTFSWGHQVPEEIEHDRKQRVDRFHLTIVITCIGLFMFMHVWDNTNAYYVI